MNANTNGPALQAFIDDFSDDDGTTRDAPSINVPFRRTVLQIGTIRACEVTGTSRGSSFHRREWIHRDCSEWKLNLLTSSSDGSLFFLAVRARIHVYRMDLFSSWRGPMDDDMLFPEKADLLLTLPPEEFVRARVLGEEPEAFDLGGDVEFNQISQGVLNGDEVVVGVGTFGIIAIWRLADIKDAFKKEFGPTGAVNTMFPYAIPRNVNPSSIWGVAIAGNRLAVSNNSHLVTVFEAPSLGRCHFVDDPNGSVLHRHNIPSVDLSIDGRWLLSAGIDGQVILRDLLHIKTVQVVESRTGNWYWWVKFLPKVMISAKSLPSHEPQLNVLFAEDLADDAASDSAELFRNEDSERSNWRSLASTEAGSAQESDTNEASDHPNPSSARSLDESVTWPSNSHTESEAYSDFGSVETDLNNDRVQEVVPPPSPVLVSEAPKDFVLCSAESVSICNTSAHSAIQYTCAKLKLSALEQYTQLEAGHETSLSHHRLLWRWLSLDRPLETRLSICRFIQELSLLLVCDQAGYLVVLDMAADENGTLYIPVKLLLPDYYVPGAVLGMTVQTVRDVELGTKLMPERADQYWLLQSRTPVSSCFSTPAQVDFAVGMRYSVGGLLSCFFFCLVFGSTTNVSTPHAEKERIHRLVAEHKWDALVESLDLDCFAEGLVACSSARFRLFCLAARQGNIDILNALLENDKDSPYRDDCQNQPMYHKSGRPSAAAQEHPCLCSILQMVDDNGRTAISHAIDAGHISSAFLLIRHLRLKILGACIGMDYDNGQICFDVEKATDQEQGTDFAFNDYLWDALVYEITRPDIHGHCIWDYLIKFSSFEPAEASSNRDAIAANLVKLTKGRVLRVPGLEHNINSYMTIKSLVASKFGTHSLPPWCANDALYVPPSFVKSYPQFLAALDSISFTYLTDSQVLKMYESAPPYVKAAEIILIAIILLFCPLLFMLMLSFFP